MLILEVKMPGVGLPAVVSALAFLLFFWSRYLSGTADQLEILLFLVGLICLGLELFVFPGFGVFGLSGFALIVASIVMASHTFVWPTQEYEYRQMAGTLVPGGRGHGGGRGRRGPGGEATSPRSRSSTGWSSRRETVTGSGLRAGRVRPPSPPMTEGYESFAFLMGETGRTTTVLKPTRGRRGSATCLVEVRADGFLHRSRHALIEVVDVQGIRRWSSSRWREEARPRPLLRRAGRGRRSNRNDGFADLLVRTAPDGGRPPGLLVVAEVFLPTGRPALPPSRHPGWPSSLHGSAYLALASSAWASSS